MNKQIMQNLKDLKWVFLAGIIGICYFIWALFTAYGVL